MNNSKDKPNKKNTKKVKIQKKKSKTKKRTTNNKSLKRLNKIEPNFINAHNNSFEPNRYLNNVNLKLSQFMDYQRYNIYDPLDPNVYSITLQTPPFDISSNRKILRTEFKTFVQNICIFLKAKNKILIDEYFLKLFYDMSRYDLGYGKIIFMPIGNKDQDFVVNYNVKLESVKGNRLTSAFHLTFHGKTFNIPPNIVERANGGYEIDNTGSVHIIAGHPILSVISGLHYSSKKLPHLKDSYIPLLRIDDSSAVYDQSRLINQGELVARLNIGIVQHNGKFWFQVLSINYHPFLNDLFFNEIIKIIHTLNMFITRTPILDGLTRTIMLPDLSIQNNDLIHMITEFGYDNAVNY